MARGPREGARTVFKVSAVNPEKKRSLSSDLGAVNWGVKLELKCATSGSAIES